MYTKSIVIATILAATAFSVIATPLAYAQGDSSETSTDQEIKQKNVGSGESQNNNCAENVLESTTSDTECQFNNSPPP
jgi:hypothetical protein